MIEVVPYCSQIVIAPNKIIIREFTDEEIVEFWEAVIDLTDAVGTYNGRRKAAQNNIAKVYGYYNNPEQQRRSIAKAREEAIYAAQAYASICLQNGLEMADPEEVLRFLEPNGLTTKYKNKARSALRSRKKPENWFI